MGVDHISNPKVKAYIIKKKLLKDEAKRFRQTGGERGLAARKARGIHAKIDLESDDDKDMEDVEEEEKESVKVAAKIKVAPKKVTKKKVFKNR